MRLNPVVRIFPSDRKTALIGRVPSWTFSLTYRGYRVGTQEQSAMLAFSQRHVRTQEHCAMLAFIRSISPLNKSM